MCVARRQHEAAKPLQVRMRHDGFDQRLAETVSLFRRVDEDIGQPGERRAVGDDARKAYLPRTGTVEPEGQRVGDRAGEELTRDAAGPVALLVEVAVNV